MAKHSSDIGEKIKRLRSFRGMTCAELADAVGCTRPYLSAVENGRYPASTKILRKLQKVLDVNQGYFTSEGEPDIQDTSRMYNRENLNGGAVPQVVGVDAAQAGSISTNTTRQIPFFQLSESGHSSIQFDEFPDEAPDAVGCPHDIIDPKAFALRMNGSAMEPLIPSGSIVVVAPGRMIRENRPVLAKLSNGEMLCRVYQAQREQVILVPYNHEHRVRLINASSIEWIYPIVRVEIEVYSDPVA